MPEPMTEQELQWIEDAREIWSKQTVVALIAEVRRLRELSAKQHFLEAINSELQAVNSKLRELHADALRQIKLEHEKADSHIKRLEKEIEDRQQAIYDRLGVLKTPL